MKKLSRIAALLAASAMLFGAVSCSDGSGSGSSGGSGGSGGGDPAPAGATEYVWNFQATALTSALAWSVGTGNTKGTTGTELEKVKLAAAGTYESTPAGLTMNLAADSEFNKISPAVAKSGSVTVESATSGSIEPLANVTVKVSVKGPFKATMICAGNSSTDKVDRYAYIKVAGAEVAAPNKTTNILPAAGQIITYSYTGTDTVDVEFGGSGITRIHDVKIETPNGDAGTKVAGEVKSLGSFTAATDNSTANDEATLGLIGTSVTSSADTVATAEIADGKIAITSVAAGSADITVKDADDHEATIKVTVNAVGEISISKITKYVASTGPIVKYFTEGTTSVAATNGDASVITGGDATFAFSVDGFSEKSTSAWTANDKVTFNGIKVGCDSTIKESASGAKDASLTVAAGEIVGYAQVVVTAVKACTIKSVAASTGQTQSANLGTAIYVNDTLVNTPAGGKISTVDQTLATPVALAAGQTATIKVAVYAATAWSKTGQTSVACDMYFGNIVITAEAVE